MRDFTEQEIAHMAALATEGHSLRRLARTAAYGQKIRSGNTTTPFGMRKQQRRAAAKRARVTRKANR